MQISLFRVDHCSSYHSLDLPLLEKISLGQESFCYANRITITSSYLFFHSFIGLESLTCLELGEYALKGGKASSLLLSGMIQKKG